MRTIWAVKNFKVPELDTENKQLAFKMLVAGVGFYREKSLARSSRYEVYSHAGDEIGAISCMMVNTLIHILRANYRGCKNRQDHVVCYDRLWYDKDKIKHLESITFGFNESMNPYIEGLMEHFWLHPVTKMVHLWPSISSVQ